MCDNSRIPITFSGATIVELVSIYRELLYSNSCDYVTFVDRQIAMSVSSETIELLSPSRERLYSNSYEYVMLDCRRITMTGMRQSLNCYDRVVRDWIRISVCITELLSRYRVLL